MKLLIAFLWDSYKEATHTKLFYILLILVGGFLLVLLSIGYSPAPVRDAVSGMLRSIPGKLEVGEVRVLSSEGWSSRIEAGVTLHDPAQYLRWVADERARTWMLKNSLFVTPHVTLKGKGAEMHALVRMSDVRDPNKVRFELRIDRRNIDEELKPILERELRRAGLVEEEVEIVSTEGVWTKKARIRGRASSFHLTRGGEVTFLFGAWTMKTPWGKGIATVVYGIQYLVFEWVACLGAVVFSLIATAGMIPTLLRRGTVEFWLSKPVGRVRLILFKFLGGLVFILPPAIVLIGGSFLIVSVRSGLWNFWFLTSLAVFVLYFAVLHALCMMFGMLTRSTLAAILLTVLIWSLAGGTYLVRQTVGSLPEDQAPSGVVTATKVASWALPRTAEAGGITTHFMKRGVFLEGQIEESEMQGMGSFSLTESVIQCFAYIVFAVGFTILMFIRRDF